jgi:hypothetical protein
MKNLILAVLIVLMACLPCHAFADRTNATQLEDSSGTEISSYALTSGVAVTSAGVFVRHNVGFAVLVVTEDKAGGAGDVDIYAQYSMDGTNYYRPYTSDMSGTITQEGNIVTAIQNVTRYIIFTPRLGNWIKITFDPDADSQVTANLYFLEDR